MVTDYQINCAMAAWWRSEDSAPYREALTKHLWVFAGKPDKNWQPDSGSLGYHYRNREGQPYATSMDAAIDKYLARLSMDSAGL